jgi:thiamine-monophosphate kinase
VKERDLIDRIVSRLPPSPPEILHGIGDDTALLRVRESSDLLVTTDSQREGVHFRWDWMTPEEVGYRLVVVNASDVYSKGGKPFSAFVTLALPSGFSEATVDKLYDGILAGCLEFGAYLSGGDISRTTGGVDLTMTLLGMVPKDQFIPRNGLVHGDRIYSIGRPGFARAGYLALSRGDFSEKLSEPIATFKRPRTFPSFPSWFLKHPFLSASMDSSDGLGQALSSLARSSGVSIVLDSAPDLDYLSPVANVLSVDPRKLALEGGEDYDLVVGVSEDKAKEFESVARDLFHDQSHDQVTYWGRVDSSGVAGAVVTDGTYDIWDWGFDHVGG